MCVIKEIISFYEKEIQGFKYDLRDFEDPESGSVDKILFVTDFDDSLSRKEVYERLDNAPDDLLSNVFKEHSGFTSIIEKRA